MNVFVGFIIGFGVGTVITFFTIILFAKTMDKPQKEALIEKAREKWRK